MHKLLHVLAACAVLALSSAPALAADTIKIGVAGAHSGDLASYGIPPLRAAQIIADEYNAKGGLLGKQLEIIAQDDQCKPELANNAATKLISDGAVIVMGHICSGATIAAIPAYANSKIISVSPSATTPALTKGGKNPYFFRTIANDDDQARLAAEFITKKLGKTKVAYIHDNGDYGKGYAEAVRREIGNKAAVVLFEAINPDAPDFSAVVKKVRKEKADVLVFGGYHPAASKLVTNMRKNHMDIPLVGPDGLKDEQLIKMAGKYAEGLYASQPQDTSDLPSHKAAHANHVKKFGNDPGIFYYNAYAATLAIVNAIEKAGSLDSQKIIDALHNDFVETPVGKIRFNSLGEPVGVGLSMYQVQNGKFVELKDSTMMLN
ncbi:MAG: branched-chain amino acid ABC transporter substrate-binding protein [Desulfovibrionaceae bacterium]|nr:branched-chain amino acid ABC transporter substrate-binding protein [Desulfovibrionaceae bacterium]MBR5735161.1 branched-chain amino acid ABC transporter substrate-binding protein [Desulfovibrionaceae bacterium]